MYLIGLPLTMLTGLYLHWSVPMTYLVMYLSEDIVKMRRRISFTTVPASGFGRSSNRLSGASRRLSLKGALYRQFQPQPCSAFSKQWKGKP